MYNVQMHLNELKATMNITAVLYSSNCNYIIQIASMEAFIMETIRFSVKYVKGMNATNV